MLASSTRGAYAGGFAHGSAAASRLSTREAIVCSLVNLGFAPAEAPSAGPGVSLNLTSCPFRDAVTHSPSGRQICHLHHGLVAGIAAASGGVLDEFVINAPRVVPCRVRFRELTPTGKQAP